jgi:hypothetical protein
MGVAGRRGRVMFLYRRGMHPNPGHPPLGVVPPAYPVRPAPPKRRGPGVLLVVLGIVVVFCLGVPGAAAGAYLLQENGPYHQVGAVCGTMNSQVTKDYIAGVPGEPIDEFAGPVGCNWERAGQFGLRVTIELLHRKPLFNNSVERAKDWYRATRTRVHDGNLKHTFVGEDTWGIGDEAYLAFTSHDMFSGKARVEYLILVARIGNAVIEIWRHTVVPDRNTPSSTEATERARQFREPALVLFRDVVEDLR